MKILVKAHILILLALSQAAKANVVPVKMNSQEKVPMVRWLYKQDDAFPKKAPVPALVTLKRAQQEERFGDCLKAAGKARLQASTLIPWISVVELECARKQAINGTTAEALDRVIQSSEKQKDALLYGPQAQLLKQNIITAYLTLLEFDIKSNRARAWRSIEHLLRMQSGMNETSRAKLFRLAGELCFMQQKLEAAREFTQRSLAEVESEELRAKLHQIESVLMHKETEAPAKKVDEGNPVLEASTPELELQTRVTTALKAGDLLPAMEDAVQLMTRFPGGTRAKWAGERVLETYLSLVEKTDPKVLIFREKIIQQMEKVDAERAYEFARVLYNRGQYSDSLLLAKRAIEGFGSSARSTKAVEIAADSALHLERYDQARSYFDLLIEKHSGTVSAREALFRSALIEYRRKEYSAAASFLERLLALPQVGNLELSTRYWLWRCLQKMKSDRAQAQSDILLAKFPFSYYGLRTRAELNNGTLEWSLEPNTKVSSQLWLTNTEKKTWERVQLLLQAGWLEEAQTELKELPLPTRPEEKALRARLWASALNYVNASKLVNEAWDEMPEIRSQPFLRAAFPIEFNKVISAQASLRKLDKNLVLSLIKQESAFQIRATSTSNALGLMQIIPPTAKEIATDLKMGNVIIPDDLFNPIQNITMGTHYIAKVLKQFDGHVPLALAGYNAGPHKVERWLKARTSLQGLRQRKTSSPEEEMWFDELPWDETSYYVKAILRNLLLYRLLESGKVAVPEPVWSTSP